MKFALIVLCCVVSVALAFDAENAHFIPKSFYRIDSDGHKSDVHPVSPHIAHYLRRLRRETVSSSSSSSSSSSNGGPTFFTQQQVVHHSPDIGVASRFGGAPAGVGHVIQTTGFIDEHGRVHYQTNQGVLGGTPHSSTYQG